MVHFISILLFTAPKTFLYGKTNFGRSPFYALECTRTKGISFPDIIDPAPKNREPAIDQQRLEGKTRRGMTFPVWCTRPHNIGSLWCKTPGFLTDPVLLALKCPVCRKIFGAKVPGSEKFPADR
jgi:hypothetical protein